MNFKISIHKPVILAVMSLMALSLTDNAAAYSTNIAVMNFISACPNAAPLNTSSCSSCHTNPPALNAYGNQIKSIDPALCNPAPTANKPPVAVINSPANNSTISLGSAGTATVNFTGSGSDPDNNTPLTYKWTFAGGGASISTSNVTTPAVTFNTAGLVTVTFTVTDSKGLASTPATITLTVNPAANQAPVAVITPPTAINVGTEVSFTGAGVPSSSTLTYAWSFAGGTPSISTSTAQNPRVTFATAGSATITLIVTDKGLASTPVTTTVTVLPAVVPPPPPPPVSCTDNDHDKFNAEGGFCGPKDCDDSKAAINPGAIESCSDGIDNDCNTLVDKDDPHCNGKECVSLLLNKIEITSASWEQDDRELSVKGPWTTAGATVKLTDALLGSNLGTTTTTSSGWSFHLEELAMAPCRVRAEINGRSGERDVAYAPANCSGKPPATNNRPVANPDTATTTQSVPVNISVLLNDSDPDGDTLRIVSFTQPGHGVVTQTPSNGPILVYTPASRYYGTDTFTYTISDGHGGTAKATVTVTVQKGQSTSINVVISTATWNRSDRKLLVSGSGGGEDASVKILNANTKALLGSTQSEDDGKWTKEIEHPSVVPCKVRVEITKRSQTGYAIKQVSNAPRTCK